MMHLRKVTFHTTQPYHSMKLSAIVLSAWCVWPTLARGDNSAYSFRWDNHFDSFFALESKRWQVESLIACIERVDILTKLHSVYALQRSLMQPGTPIPEQLPWPIPPSSLDNCLAQEEIHEQLLAVQLAILEQLIYGDSNDIPKDARASKRATGASDVTEPSR